MVSALGKRGYFHRLTDASDIKGLTGKTSNAAHQPSDYIIVVLGITYFAEVKSSHDATAFRFSMCQPSQLAHALRIDRAGGQHVIWCKHVPSGLWYCIPYRQIELAKADGHKSIPWKELTACSTIS